MNPICTIKQLRFLQQEYNAATPDEKRQLEIRELGYPLPDLGKIYKKREFKSELKRMRNYRMHTKYILDELEREANRRGITVEELKEKRTEKHYASPEYGH